MDPSKRISVVAPAGWVDEADLRKGTEKLAQRWSLRIAEDIGAAEGYLAGDDARRLRELQQAFNARDIGAIIAARGGFGTTRILDALDLSGLQERPKWVVGCSDLTALLMQIWAELRLVSIHGPMVAGFHRTHEPDLLALFNLLTGNAATCDQALQPMRHGEVTGPLIGGNLTVLAHLVGTLDPCCFDGAVLFLEDVGERPYRLERALIQLDRAGILRRVSGLIIGELTRCAPPTEQGTTAIDAMMRVLGPLEKPIATGYPAAHGQRNAPFLHGARVTLTVSKDRADIQYYFEIE